jgi:thiamine biosynthesis protein ThiS
MDFKIKKILNGFREEVPPRSSITGLIKQFKELDSHMLVELNGRFIYNNQYPVIIVTENDRVEFINPNLGG